MNLKTKKRYPILLLAIGLFLIGLAMTYFTSQYQEEDGIKSMLVHITDLFSSLTIVFFLLYVVLQVLSKQNK